MADSELFSKVCERIKNGVNHKSAPDLTVVSFRFAIMVRGRMGDSVCGGRRPGTGRFKQHRYVTAAAGKPVGAYKVVICV